MGTATVEKSPPTGEGLTFEKVWASIQESRQEWKEKMEADSRKREEEREKDRLEWDERIKKADERREADDRRWDEQWEAEQQRWEKRQKELNQQFRETDRKISKLGDRIGELIEHFAASNILEKFEEFGYKFTQISRNHKLRNGNKQQLAEIDLLLQNGEYAAVVEVKSLVTTAKVKKHRKRMEIVRAYMDERGDRRKYIAAMAGALYEDAARDYALRSGMYVVEQTGDNVQIKAPPELAVW